MPTEVTVGSDGRIVIRRCKPEVAGRNLTWQDAKAELEGLGCEVHVYPGIPDLEPLTFIVFVPQTARREEYKPDGFDLSIIDLGGNSFFVMASPTSRRPFRTLQVVQASFLNYYFHSSPQELSDHLRGRLGLE